MTVFRLNLAPGMHLGELTGLIGATRPTMGHLNTAVMTVK